MNSMRQVPAAVTTSLSEAALATEGNGTTNGHAAVTSLPAHRELVDSYRRLADIFHHVLSEQSLDTLLDRVADTLAELVPYDSFTIYEADVHRRMLIPLMARGQWADEIMNEPLALGKGVTGWAVQRPQA